MPFTCNQFCKVVVLTSRDDREHAKGPGLSMDAVFPLDWDSELPTSIEDFLSFLS